MLKSRQVPETKRRQRAVGSSVSVGLVGILIAGCGGATHGQQSTSTPARASATPRGVTLVFQAVATPKRPITPASLAGTVAVIGQRLRGSVPTGTVRLRGRKISVLLPGVSATAPIALEIGAPGAVGIYDWEGNVVYPARKSARTSVPGVTGDPNPGSMASGVPLYAAVTQAAKRTPRTYPLTSMSDGTFYAVDAAHRQVLAGPALSQAELMLELAHTHAPQPTPGNVRVVHVPVGTIVVSGETPDGLPSRSANGYYVLSDNPGLDGSDLIKETSSSLNEGAPQASQPGVTFSFTTAGQAAFTRLTRTLARRGASSTHAGGSPDVQHFAIVLDGRIISTPFVDFMTNPDGIGPSASSQIGGEFTATSARVIADLLAAGPLPVALTPAS